MPPAGPPALPRRKNILPLYITVIFLVITMKKYRCIGTCTRVTGTLFGEENEEDGLGEMGAERETACYSHTVLLAI